MGRITQSNPPGSGGGTAELGAHLADASDVHDASAVSYDGTASGLVATDTQAALNEVVTKIRTDALWPLWDNCYAVPTLQTITQLASGHTWTTIPGATGVTITSVKRLVAGGLQVNTSTSAQHSEPILLFNITTYLPEMSVRFVPSSVTSWGRHFYLRYVDANNWLRVVAAYELSVQIRVAGVTTTIAVFGNLNSGSRYIFLAPDRPNDVTVGLRGCHTNFGTSGYCVTVHGHNGFGLGRIGLTTAQWTAIGGITPASNQVGFGLPQETKFYDLRIGKEMA